MSLGERKALEAIALITEVYEPNGAWNCQDWVIEVLRKAVEKDLLNAQEMDEVLTAARQ